jgi:Lipase maturation factor
MWIAACGNSIDSSPWVYRFLVKLLEGDQEIMGLMAVDPWENEPEAPKFICVDSYIYRFHRKTSRASNGEQLPYWDREFCRRVYPAEGGASIESLKNEIPREFF